MATMNIIAVTAMQLFTRKVLQLSIVCIFCRGQQSSFSQHRSLPYDTLAYRGITYREKRGIIEGYDSTNIAALKTKNGCHHAWVT